jgi:hypothetical protein
VFLSAEWMELLAAALPASDPSVSVRIAQVVTGAPAGDVRYCVVIDAGRARVETCVAGDVTLSMPYEVAVGLATGRLRPQDVLQSGDVRVSGDLSLLQTVTSVLGDLGPALAEVRDHTTYAAT